MKFELQDKQAHVQISGKEVAFVYALGMEVSVGIRRTKVGDLILEGPMNEGAKRFRLTAHGWKEMKIPGARRPK